MPTWNPHLYMQFGDERTQPSIDLANRVANAAPGRIIDIGCGPGNSTAVLRQRWPDAAVVGLDSSPEMIAAATANDPAGTWVLADAAAWRADQPFDVVFSNAALQWLPDHATLFPHLLAQAAPGGALAVQIPTHVHSPAHQLITQVANDPAWRDRIASQRPLTIETPGFYYDVLQPIATRVDIWETVYSHVLPNSAAIVEFMRGTGMRPYLEALADDAERALFLDKMRAGVAQHYPPQRDGRVLFPFHRLFMVAYREGVG